MAGLLEYTKNGQVTEPPLYRFMRGNVQSFLNSIPDPSKMTPEEQLAMGLNANPIMGLLGTTAYHGSPYLFDKFDINKVGTGTGVQSYGRGMYFTESPEVAKAYGSEYFDPTKLQNMPKGPSGVVEFKTIEDAMSALGTKSGAVYKVDIPDKDIPKLLNWDIPIKDQPEMYKLIKNNIKDKDFLKSFENNAESGITGSNAYLNYIGGKTDAEKSENALKLGIKGIKYLDEGNSKAGKPINNFVVFDPSEVKILEKGLLGK